MDKALDLKRIGELGAIYSQLLRMREDLYKEHSGCACTRDALCSFHAQVWNDLGEVANGLARVIDELAKKE